MRPGLPAYEWWQTPPDEVFLSVYVFNVTNSQEFLSGKDKRLHIHEIGPYVYQEKLVHSNVTNNRDGTMSYTANKSAIFMPELNTLDLQAKVIVPNIPLLGMSSFLWNQTFAVKWGFSMLASRLGSKPFLETTVQNYLWNLTDPLTKMARAFLPTLVPKHNFALLDQIYENYVDRLTVHIGHEKGPKEFMKIQRLNGKPGYGVWKNSTCDSIEGTSDGVCYHQEITKEETLRYYRKAFCRAANLKYTGDSHLYGVKAYKFELLNNSFARPSDGDDCYTPEGLPPLPSGVSDVSPCFFGFPLALSFPHFMMTDETVRDRVSGLKPDYNKHQSYIYTEPLTGVPLTAAARSQCNLVMRPVKSGFPKLKPFYNMTVPLMWIEYKQVGIPWKVEVLTYFCAVVLKQYQVYISLFVLCLGLYNLLWVVVRLRMTLLSTKCLVNQPCLVALLPTHAQPKEKIENISSI